MKQSSQNLRLAFALTLAAVGLLLNAAPAHASDLPRLRLQTWATQSHIYWLRALGPDRWAVSYYNAGPKPGAGLDVLDRAGTILQRYWPLPEGSCAVAVHPDGTPVIGTRTVLFPPFHAPYPAILPGGRIVRVSEGGGLEIMDPGDPTVVRPYAASIWNASDPHQVEVMGFEAQADGQLLVWGGFVFSDGSVADLCRIKADETRDPAFRPVISGEIVGLRIAEDGSVLVHARNEESQGATTERWLRLNADGSLRSSRQMTFPEGTYVGPSWQADDDSVILSLHGGSTLRTISPDGSVHDRESFGFGASGRWGTSDLVALGGGAVATVQRSTCQGPTCLYQDWLTILPGDGGPATPVLWMPPYSAVARLPMLFVDHLSPEATYVIQTSADLIQWRDLEFQPDRSVSSDRTRLFFQDYDSEANPVPSRRFYRTLRTSN